MSSYCPVSLQSVNENIVRTNAIITTLVLLIFVTTSLKWLIVFLALDFLIRGFYKPKYSILTMFSSFITDIFRIPPKIIDAAPKIFSAKIGFIFSIAIGILSIVNYSLSIVLTSALILCTILEGFFGYCVGCKIYSIKENFKARYVTTSEK